MQEALYKPVDVEGPQGLWGFFNTKYPKLTASSDGYLVIVAPDERLQRLDDFTLHQEQSFWDFTFSSAAKGLKDRCARGFAEAAGSGNTENSVMCAVNDGVVAWQGVGTTHSHVIWNKKEGAVTPFNDIAESLIADRTKFGGTERPCLPLISVQADTGAPDFVRNLREWRGTLTAAFTDAGMTREDTGFSHYTTCTGRDPREGGRMTVELWSKEHHSVASLTQFVRHWNGLWDNPISVNPMGLQYGAIRPAILKP